MNLKRLAIQMLALFIGATVAQTAQAGSTAVNPTPPAFGQFQDRGDWDAPPQELNELQRQGFHDGIEGARKDFGNHRQPDVNNRDEYRHPNLPPEQRKAYREGFRRGYSVAMSHLMGGGPEPQMRPPDPGRWDMPPGEFNDIQRRGFHDGMEGAQKDFENHRQPDVNNRDEYRHPDLPPEMRDAYRAGFGRGYDRAMSHLMGQPYRY
jgi:hypothetical protein